MRPQEVRWRDEAPIGKLDLLLSLDFRITSTTLFSDIVLPAATWYEKHDLSSTDMHPFVHAFSPAISPPWETKTDFEAFHRIARGFSWLAEKHLGKRKDIVAMPLQHDSADATAQPGGRVLDWKAGECEPIPGKTMPRLVEVERDYPAIAEKMAALGPMVETRRADHQGRHHPPGGRSGVPARARTARWSAGSRPAGRRWPRTPTPPRRSWRCPARPTAGWPSRASKRWSVAPAPSWPTWPRRARASESPSPTPSPDRSR